MGVINLGILIRKLSHVFLRKDEAATELSTLGFVKNTDYAGETVSGVIKATAGAGLAMGPFGDLRGNVFSPAGYEQRQAYTIISKGTLENVKSDVMARALVDIAAAQIATPVAGTYTVKLTYDGTAWGVTIIQDT